MTGTKKSHKLSPKKTDEFRGQLLKWYDQNKRQLPWRAERGDKPVPYHVWLSEIMLQQTTVSAVKDYFLKFISRWPDIHKLAKAPRQDIMNAWAGLGYYARARNLHKCAVVVSKELGGMFPEDEVSLKKLPGIGEYTSAAIRTIAFDKPATVMDGNIERIIARFFDVHTPMPEAKKELKALAHHFFEGFKERPGDLAQALMDLGATICIPKTPRCALCPVSESCAGYRKGTAGALPVKAKKKAKPQKFGYVFLVRSPESNTLLLHKRPEKGLLAGMHGLPTSKWISRKSYKSLEKSFLNIEFEDTPALSVYHSFTHFDLELSLKYINVENMKHAELPGEYFWAELEIIDEYGLPSVFQKVFTLFMSAEYTS